MRLEYFQLIDRIEALDPTGRTIRAQAQVPQTSTIFEGHFPFHPLMPGVLLIETMAQTSGWMLIAASGFERIAYLAAVKEAKLRSFVTPGQSLTICANLLHDGSGYAVTAATVAVSGKTVCDATLTLRVAPFPNPELHRSMKEIAGRIGLSTEASADG